VRTNYFDVHDPSPLTGKLIREGGPHQRHVLPAGGLGAHVGDVGKLGGAFDLDGEGKPVCRWAGLRLAEGLRHSDVSSGSRAGNSS